MSKLRRAVALISAIGVLASVMAVLPFVTPAASDPGPNDGQESDLELSEQEFSAIDIPPVGNFATFGGGELNLVSQTIPGAVADEFGHEPSASFDVFSTAETYDDAAGEVTHSVLGDVHPLPGADDFDLESAIDPDRLDMVSVVRTSTGDQLLSARGPQADGFPRIGPQRALGTDKVLGIAALQRDDARNNKVFAVFTTSGIDFYRYDGDSNGFALLSSHTEPLSMPWSDVYDAYQRPFWQASEVETTARRNAEQEWQNTATLVGRRAFIVPALEAMVLSFGFDSENLPTVSVVDSHVLPVNATDARIRHDFDVDGLMPGTPGAHWSSAHAVVVHRTPSSNVAATTKITGLGGDDTTSERLFEGPGGPGPCPLQDGELPGLAAEVQDLHEIHIDGNGYNLAVGCVGVDDTDGTMEIRVHRELMFSHDPLQPGLPISEERRTEDSSATSFVGPNVLGERLHRPQLELNFPCSDFLIHHPPLAGSSFGCNDTGRTFGAAGDDWSSNGRWDLPSSVVAHVFALAGDDGLLLLNRGWAPFEFSTCDSLNVDCAIAGPSATTSVNHKVVQRGLDPGSTAPLVVLPFSPQPYEILMRSDELKARTVEKGNPMPFAILVAPPTVQGAGQSLEENVFEQTHEQGFGGDATSRHEAGAFVGAGVDTPVVGFEVKAKVEGALDQTISAESSISVTDFYEGNPDGLDHVVLYQTHTLAEWVGRMTYNSFGLGKDTTMTIGTPTGVSVVARNMKDFAAEFPDTWDLIGPSMLDAVPTRPTDGPELYRVGDPGAYVPFTESDLNDANGPDAINDYCIGDTTGTTVDQSVQPRAPKVFHNPFLFSPPEIAGPSVMVANPKTVLAGSGESVVIGSSIGVDETRAHSRSTEFTVGAEFEVRVGKTGYGTFGGHYEWTKGSGVTNSISQGVSFTAGVGTIPNPDLDFEQYKWLMFVCKTPIDTPFGPLPIWVHNFAVEGYGGTGGIEELAPVSLESPVASQVTDTTPDFAFEHPNGTVQSYDLELEAVGAPDARSATGLADLGDHQFQAMHDRDPDLAVSWEDLGFATELRPNQLYRWRVTADDVFGNPVASDYQFFVTDGPPQEVEIQLTDPTPEVSTPTIFNITHRHIEGDVTYVLYLCDGTQLTSDEPSFEVTFAEAGICPVTIEVTSEGGSTNGQINVVVGPKVQDRPYGIEEDTPRTVPVEIGMLHGSEGADAVVATTSPDHGTLDWASDGSFTYTPDPDYHGLDSFQYTASGGGVTRKANVTLTIAPVNDPPTVPDKSYATSEGATVARPFDDLLFGYQDVDGDGPASVDLAADPGHGSVSLLPSSDPADPIYGPGASFTYEPDAGFCGTDTFRFTVTDLGPTPATSAPITVTIEVTCVNDPPVADEDPPVTVAEDGSSTFDVLGNDTDADGDDLAAAITAPPAHGAAVVEADGRITYTPDPDYCGGDSLAYVADDGLAQSAPVMIEVTVTCVDDAPMTAPDFTVSVPEDGSTSVDLASGAVDADGDAVSVVITAGPSAGPLLDEGNGTFTYTPDPDYCGPDSITYLVTDGTLDSDEGTVTIDVTCVNDAPVTGADPSVVLDEDTSAVATPLSNDTDVEGTDLTLVVTDQPTIGELEVDGAGEVTYTPDPNACGSDSFTYVADDGELQSDPVTVAIEVTCVNDPPVAAADPILHLDEDGAGAATPLANDSDVDGDDLIVEIVDQPDHGTIDVVGGLVAYAPDADVCGTDAFTYVASDGELTSNPITIVVKVACVNDPPVVNADPAVHVDEDDSVTTDPLANDTDADGDELFVVVTEESNEGDIEVDGDGRITYTPAPDFCGTDTYSYVVTDGTVESDPVVVEVTVACVNDAPVVVGDEPIEVDEDGSVTADPIANDTDADGDELFVVVTEDPTDGDIEVDEDSVLTYTPDPDFCGTDSFTYVVTDGLIESDPVVVEVTVECVNDAPRAEGESYSMSEGDTLEVPAPGVLGNDADVDGDELSADVVSGPANGELDLEGDGSFSYSPDEGWFGVDSFTYEADDGRGGTNEATVSIRVRGNTSVDAAPVVLRLRGLRLYLLTFEAELSDSGGTALAGKEIRFASAGGGACVAVTDSAGVARCSVNLVSWVLAVLSPYSATFDGDEGLNPSSSQARILRL